eukprot:TRINITY_DN1934_c0_g1_i2.p1 TRINITY_DN1934_c0_g1~~TRINITY_DN1934_c0_g1_i2.p1  ORF type:complete len:631 (-),score=160.07 TRINITY_DN1934_c0_g1_i2:54-1946(-)
MSLKEKQTSTLIRMLNLNKAPESKESLDEPWKLLVYDEFCRDIVAPLLRVGDLRKHGVTLHLSLMGERQAVADVPAVYFVLPTKENIKRIGQDCGGHLYDSYHLNFASHLTQDLMEELALSTLESSTTHQISKIFDQYVHFISYESDLFSLGQKNSFFDFNDHSISDSKAQLNISNTVESLFSVLVTLGVVPIIRCPKNGAAEAIATQLDQKLHDHLQSMGNLFSESSSGGATNFQRPVLILLDRSVDLPIMLHHPWTYQPLVHDLLDMKLNRVQIEVNNPETNKKETKHYDLDEHDSFWTQNTFSPFQNIGESVNSHLKEYKATMDDFKKMSGGMDIENYDESQVLGRTKDLGSFVNLVPQLKEKKKMIDAHTNIATSLLQNIRDRQLDSYFSIEENLITHTPFDRKELNNLILNESGSTPQDRLRLFLIHYIINNDNIPPAELESMMDALRKSNINLDSVNYLKKNKAVMNLLGGNMGLTSGSTGGTGAVRGLLQKVNVDSFGLGSVMSNQLGTLFNAGVRALFPTTKELPATRLLDSVMELKSDPQVDQFLYFDPKVGKKMKTSIPRRNTPFKEAIVFVIGGGNYLEYQNVQEYSRKHPGKKVIYGSTEIMTPSAFLDQLAKLGSTS